MPAVNMNRLFPALHASMHCELEGRRNTTDALPPYTSHQTLPIFTYLSTSTIFGTSSLVDTCRILRHRKKKAWTCGGMERRFLCMRWLAFYAGTLLYGIYCHWRGCIIQTGVAGKAAGMKRKVGGGHGWQRGGMGFLYQRERMRGDMTRWMDD